MPNALSLRSVDELFAFMALAGDDDVLWQQIDLTQLRVVIPISIKGDQRDGRIDAKGATLIRDLQKNIEWAFKTYGSITTGGRRNRIRVRVAYGSDKNEVDYTEVIKEAIKKMTGSQVMACILGGMLFGTGYLVYSKNKDSDVEVVKLQLMQQHAERMVDKQNISNQQIIDGLLEQARLLQTAEATAGRDVQAPIRKHIRSMGRKETISVGNGPDYAKKDAYSMLEPLQTTTPMFYVHCDGSYSLLAVELHEGTQVIKIAQGDIQVLGLLEHLDQTTRDSIVSTVDRSMERRTRMAMNLQVDVYFKNNKIHHAIVLGEGAPRSTTTRHFRLENISAGIPTNEMHFQGE